MRASVTVTGSVFDCVSPGAIAVCTMIADDISGKNMLCYLVLFALVVFFIIYYISR